MAVFTGLGSNTAPSFTFSSDSNTGIYSPGADQLALGTGGTGRIFIDSSGNVGVGTSNLAFPFQARSTTNAVVAVLDNGGIPQVVGLDDANASTQLRVAGEVLSFSGNGGGGNEHARVDNIGRVIIGDTSADAFGSDYPTLQVIRPQNAARNASILIKEIELGTGWPRLIINKNRSNNVMQTDNKLGSVDFYGDDSSSDVLAGRVEVTAESNWSAGAYYGTRFAVSTVFATTLEEKFRVASNGGTFIWGGSTGADLLHLATRGTATTGNYLIRGGYSSSGPGDTGTQCFYVYNNGDVTNTNNNYGAISDIKLKENIVDANSQWDDIKALQVRNYNFKEGQTHTQIGLVAQEVELVSPGLVSESPDRDEDGNNLGTVTKSVNYSVLYMKAVKALQEAMERIETLEQRLNDAGIS